MSLMEPEANIKDIHLNTNFSKEQPFIFTASPTHARRLLVRRLQARQGLLVIRHHSGRLRQAVQES
jgi:hypothetical protein